MANDTKDANDLYRDTLNNASFAAFDRSAVSQEGIEFVQELHEHTLAYEAKYQPRARARRKQDAEAFELAIGAFASDFIWHSGNDESEGYMYRPADKEELSHTLVSYDAFKKLRACWAGMGYIEETGFTNFTEEFVSGSKTQTYRKARRFRAKKPLLDLAQRNQITATTVRDHFKISHCPSSEFFGELRLFGNGGSGSVSV